MSVAKGFHEEGERNKNIKKKHGIMSEMAGCKGQLLTNRPFTSECIEKSIIFGDILL